MTILGISEPGLLPIDELVYIETDDDGRESPRHTPVECGYIDGHTGPRRCCYDQCHREISGTPLVSEGLPYHVECYLMMRRVVRIYEGE